MIDIAQSQLLAIVAGAVLASSLLGVGAYQHSKSEDLGVVGALDALALRIGSSGCSASRPTATVELSSTWEALPPAVVSLTLFPDHVRAARDGRPALSSAEFPRLILDAPLELPRGAVLWLHYLPLDHACAVSAAPA